MNINSLKKLARALKTTFKIKKLAGLVKVSIFLACVGTITSFSPKPRK